MKTIRLKNYKCFEDTGNLELKPLTFLVGSNSSGKSSFLEFFPLLQQSMFTNRDGAFLWVGNNVDLNDFQTVVRNGEGEIVIEFEIDRIPIDSGKIGTGRTGLSDVKVGIDISKTDIGDTITEMRLDFNQQQMVIKLKEKETDEVYVNGELMSYQDEAVVHSPTNSLLPKLLFEGEIFETDSRRCRKELYTWIRENLKDAEEERIMPPSLLFRLRYALDKQHFENRLNSLKKEDIEVLNLSHIYNLALFANVNEIIDLINYYMLELSNRIEFIQPLRAPAERYYRKRNISVNRITPSGDNVAMFMLRLQKEGLLKKFNEWLHDNDMNFEVDLNANEEGGFIELKIKEEGKESKNMVDVGFGYSQILPILATIWKDLNSDGTPTNRASYCTTSIVLIEQPELHLHPRFQRQFAILLSKCVQQIAKSNRDIRFIIETHSQDILNSVGRSVAYGEFDASLVNIYMFNAQRENMKHYVETAYYTKEGFLENWPIGFFE